MVQLAGRGVVSPDEAKQTFQIVQCELAEIATLTEAARNLVYKAAWMLDRGQVEAVLISMAKWYAGEVRVRVADESLLTMISVVSIETPRS